MCVFQRICWSCNNLLSTTIEVFKGFIHFNSSLTKLQRVRMISSASGSLKITSKVDEKYREILTPSSIEFLEKLHKNFEGRRQGLLVKRIDRQRELENGVDPTFLTSTKCIRDGNWTVAPLPKPLLKRRVEITGPVDQKMVINAFNSGSDCYMADFEDSNTPLFTNQLAGQLNLKWAIERKIDFKDEKSGKDYKLADKIATLLVRPRGWHLDEKHVTVDGQRMSGSLFDFGLFFWNCSNLLLKKDLGPYFYLPKMESHLEARLWNDIFIFAQNELGLPLGTIKATCLIEHIMAAFEMDEILYELRDHSAGLNAGRWDYIFSCIKKFKHRKDLVFADRSQITMTAPFMRAYALLLIKTCHKRNAPAIGGMSALIPIKNDEAANAKALDGVRADKKRDATDGYDGGWVAHPALVQLAMTEMTNVLGQGEKTNQIEKQLTNVEIKASDLLDFRPNGPITEKGLRQNVSVGLQYLASWLVGTGCVAIFNSMEDAATVEISRSQIWQWIFSTNGKLEDGRKITCDLVQSIVQEEIKNLKQSDKLNLPYDKAGEFFTKVATNPKFEEFLTLSLYENLE